MNSRILLNEDFHRGIGEPFGHWIIITLHFDDLGESEEEQVLANYMINDGNDKSITNGNYTFVFRPKFHIRQKLYELTTENATFNKRRIAFKELISNNIISKETYEAVAFVRTKVDFNDNGIYETIVGDFNKFIFPNPNDDDAGSLGIKKPPYFALGSEVACTYVKELRNVVADLKYYKTNPLYKLLTALLNKSDFG